MDYPWWDPILTCSSITYHISNLEYEGCVVSSNLTNSSNDFSSIVPECAQSSFGFLMKLELVCGISPIRVCIKSPHIVERKFIGSLLGLKLMSGCFRFPSSVNPIPTLLNLSPKLTMKEPILNLGGDEKLGGSHKCKKYMKKLNGLLSGVLLPLGESNLPEFSSSKLGTDERANYRSLPTWSYTQGLWPNCWKDG